MDRRVYGVDGDSEINSNDNDGIAGLAGKPLGECDFQPAGKTDKGPKVLWSSTGMKYIRTDTVPKKPPAAVLKQIAEILETVANQCALSSYASAGDPALQDTMRMHALWAGRLKQALTALQPYIGRSTK